jgi:hypothetical protein
MGKLYIFRQRLPDYVPMLGVTATLTASIFKDVVDSAGVWDETRPLRNPINQPLISMYLEAAKDTALVQKRVVLLIITAAIRKHGYRPDLLSRSIFFTKTIAAARTLRRSIIFWLGESGFAEAEIACRVRIYHGQLSGRTRKGI